MLLLIVLLDCFGVETPAKGQTPESPAPLVLKDVDTAEKVAVAGNVSAVAILEKRSARDLGPIDDSAPVEGLYLLLRRPPERETALRQFLVDAQSSDSPEFHRWLTPEEFGRRFGPADSDITALTAWLEAEGLTVKPVYPGRIAIGFSGSAAAVNAALGTEIHRYALPVTGSDQRSGGNAIAAGSAEAVQIASVLDPRVPAAFAGLVAGIAPLGGRAQAQLAVKGATSYDTKTHAAIAGFPLPPGATTIYELSPSDLSMQYGLKSVYAAGATGAGQTIGIISDSNVDLSLVTAYRTIFGLTPATPTVVVDGNDPGITPDATESYLDLEQAGAVAPGAALMLYTSAGTLLSDGLLTAAMRAVADNQATVLSLSFASCESALSAGGNAAWSALWQEAAAQGISVFVATGDTGSAGCDSPANTSTALSGLAVNGLASTPYDTAVGGTDLYYSSYAAGGSTLANQIAGYWGTTAATTPTVGLLQAVPEQPWNDSFGLNATDAGLYSAANATLSAGGGGASSAAITGATGAPVGYTKPGWQSGTGVPADGLRDLPDLALFSGDGANGVYLPVCAMPGDCTPAFGSTAVTITSVGGTSAAAPAMAGIQALVNAAAAGSKFNARSGLTAGIYYALATKYASATAKPFNDLTLGSNQVPCYAGTLNCTLGTSGQTKGVYAESGYAASAGYDRSSGLGSVNAANLIADWLSLGQRSTTSSLTVTPTTLVHGLPASVKVTVAPSIGTGTPTGSVTVLSSSQQAYANGLGAATLASGAGIMTLSNLPGGSYLLTAEYGGDTSFAPSLSAPLSVTVSQESDTLVSYGWVVNPLDGAVYPLASGMQLPYGSEIYLDAQPVGVNEASAASTQNAPATGSVVFTDKGSAATRSGTSALNSQGVAEWAPGTGTVGTHAVSAAYAGDASYAASTAASVASYTVFKGTTTLYLSPMQTAASTGGSVTVDLQLFSQYLPLIGTLPTGSVTVTLGGQSKTATWTSSGPLATGPAGSAIEEAVVTFTGLSAGILPLSASYPGDSNWNGSSQLWGSIPVSGTKAVPAVALNSSAASVTPSQSLTLSATVSGPSGGTASPTGNLKISWNGGTSTYVGGLTASGTNTATYSVTVPAYTLKNGTNLLIASYSGDSNYAAASSPPVAVALSASDFLLNITTPEIAVTYGKSGSASAVLAPVNGFSGPVNLSCTAPAGISCAMGSSSVTIGSGGATDSVTLAVGAGLQTGTWPVTVIATAAGHTHSAQILVAATPPAPAPVFTPPAGSYTTAQLVTLTDVAAGATFYYTTDGSTPTAASTKYTDAISITATKTIKALAAAPGYVASAVNSATYTIAPLAATPLFSPAGGAYATTQSVTITDATSGATIYYTTNGSAPTTASTKYSGAISVASSQTLSAVAVASGYSLSAVASAAYTIAPAAATPTFSPAPGTYAAAQSVTIADTTAGSVIYYTTDGSTPTTVSNRFSGAIQVSSTATIKAVATAAGYSSSAVGSATFTITVTALPTFSPAGGSYPTSQSVILSDATTGAAIYYTTNGATPTTSSARYTAPISVAATETVKAMAVASGYTASAVATASYTITTASATAIPTFNPPPGSYTTAQSVTITDATSGAAIYYTTNGAAPTTSSTKFTAPIPVSATETIQAIAVTAGQNSSPMASATYTIVPAAATPTFSPATGTYTTAQSVTITDATAGAAIYITTSGATPTTASTRYTGAIPVSATQTIKAIAVATGYTQSPVATAAYTITPAASLPVFTPAAGTYTKVQSVSIIDATAGAAIYYTTNGSTPTTASARYAGAFTVASTQTVKAVAVAAGYTQSAMASALYTINSAAAAGPSGPHLPGPGSPLPTR